MTRSHDLICGVPRRAWLAGATGLLIVLGLSALSACAGGGEDDAVAPVAPGGGAGTPTSTPAPMPDGVEPVVPAPVIIEPVPGERERTVSWRLVREAEAALVVEVQIGGPPCDAVTDVVTQEFPEQVLLTVWAGRVPGAACAGVPAALGTARLRVPLVEPLGTRSLRPGR